MSFSDVVAVQVAGSFEVLRFVEPNARGREEGYMNDCKILPKHTGRDVEFRGRSSGLSRQSPCNQLLRPSTHRDLQC